MAGTPNEGTAAEAKDRSRDEILRLSYSEATKELREKHLAEFNEIRQRLAAAAGVDWKPALTEKEKAAAQMKELLTAHPDLVTELGLDSGKQPG